jgi:hypothetical protein
VKDTSRIHRLGEQAATPVRQATLDGFVEAADGAGISVRDLPPLTGLSVQTRNTRYRIIVSRADEIIIQGGTFFADPTAARLEGASLGSNLIKVGWIGIGLRMEIRAGTQRIVTTAVRSIARDEPGAASPPH